MTDTKIYHRFNRYIVECKSETTEDDIHVELDLIDTQWNVNFCLVVFKSVPVSDLIDTQWNVNHGCIVYCDPPYDRFNRYIVECK